MFELENELTQLIIIVPRIIVSGLKSIWLIRANLNVKTDIISIGIIFTFSGILYDSYNMTHITREIAKYSYQIASVRWATIVYLITIFLNSGVGYFNYNQGHFLGIKLQRELSSLIIRLSNTQTLLVIFYYYRREWHSKLGWQNCNIHD